MYIYYLVSREINWSSCWRIKLPRQYVSTVFNEKVSNMYMMKIQSVEYYL